MGTPFQSGHTPRLATSYLLQLYSTLGYANGNTQIPKHDGELCSQLAGALF